MEPYQKNKGIDGKHNSKILVLDLSGIFCRCWPFLHRLPVGKADINLKYSLSEFVPTQASSDFSMSKGTLIFHQLAEREAAEVVSDMVARRGWADIFALNMRALSSKNFKDLQ